MVDETLDRLYRENRSELNLAIDSGLRTLGKQMMVAFQSLHRIVWDSPWNCQDHAKCN